MSKDFRSCTKRHKIPTDDEPMVYQKKHGRMCRNIKHMQRMPLSMFHANAQNKDGLHSFCKLCRSKIRKAYYLKVKRRGV